MIASKVAEALPKYIQISEMLIREIAAGHLRDGARLPPERDLASELGISVGTLRKSLAELEAKGLLERIQGSGNYIRHRPIVASIYAFFRLELIRGGGLPTARVLSVDRLPKPATAPSFGATRDAHRIRRLRSLGDQLIAVEEIWLDGRYCKVMRPAALSESLYHYYQRDLNLIIAAAEDRVGLDPMPDWTPPEFQLAPGTHAGFIERIARSDTGHAAEYSRTWFDTDKARYISRMESA